MATPNSEISAPSKLDILTYIGTHPQVQNKHYKIVEQTDDVLVLHGDIHGKSEAGIDQKDELRVNLNTGAVLFEFDNPAAWWSNGFNWDEFVSWFDELVFNS